MARKTAARKRPGKKKAAPRPASKKKAPALPRGAAHVDLVLEERHVHLLEALGRAYRLDDAGAPPDLPQVVREVLDRYGHRLLRLATPRRVGDEEE
ncbi:MAG: hypothetical protein M9894_28435 [Planctomycetes bacterium]|nr:hypothetical protein [Planctomycetota bacterium]